MRISQVGLLIISIIYLLIAIQWNFSMNMLNVEERYFILTAALGSAFISFAHKLNALGSSNIHPAVLFVLSFVVLILISAFFLSLPQSTTNGISSIDALFTATSAATVTGLAVLDTQSQFTGFGKVVILITIQLGGLGMLTFTNLFSLLFKSSSSFKNHLILGSMINESSSSNVYTTLRRIIGVTLLIELIGASLIYVTISDANIGESKVFFSIFHSISGFCNAGFSTLSAGMYEDSIRYNTSFQWIIMWLIITGGIGYNVMIKHGSIVKAKCKRVLMKMGIISVNLKATRKSADVNTLLVVRTTLLLILFGAIGFYLLERNGVLLNDRGSDLFTSVMFNSITPRTAGFNNVNMAELTSGTLFFIIFLMWVGASPGSTGGGIKTSTFALGILNLLNQIRGKDNTVIKMRLVPRQAINQVSATVLLSLLGIGITTFLLVIYEPEKEFLDLLFETVSAFSTVGLSVGITPNLSSASKVVLVFCMFLGRVSFLTFLIGLYRQVYGERKRDNVYYPDETIFIS